MVYASLALCLIPLVVLFICLALLVHDFKCTKGLWACLLGLIAVIPSVLLHMFFIEAGGFPVSTLVALLFEMLLVALIEESMKFAVMFAMPARKTELSAFLSYSMLCGFSLGCFETLVYILTGRTGGLSIVTRLPAMLIHLACTGLAGLTVYSIRKKSVKILPFLFAVLFHGVYNYFEHFKDDFRQYFAFVVVLIALFECKIQYSNLKSKFEELSLVDTDKSIKGDVDKMSEEKKSFWTKVTGLFAKKDEPEVAPATPEQTVFGITAEETVVNTVEAVHEPVEETVTETHVAVEEKRDSLSFKNNYPRIDNLFNDDRDMGGSMSESLKATSVELTEIADTAKADAKKTVTRAKAGAKKTAATAKTAAKKTAKSAGKAAGKTAKAVKKTATKAAKSTAKSAKTTAKKATTTAKKTTKAAADKATKAKKAVKKTATTAKKTAKATVKKATTAKKPAAKKPAAKKTAAKKPAAKKPAAKKTAAKKPAAKKPAAKKTAAKKTAK